MKDMVKYGVRIFLVGASLAWTLFSLSGCSPATSEESANFASIYNTVLSGTCLNCHFPGGSAWQAGVTLDLSNMDNAYNDLLNRAVQNVSNPSQCMNVRRVQPGSPTTSFLMGVLFSDYNRNNFANVSGCQPSVAHLSYVSLSSAEKGNLATWINNGANR